MYKTKYSLELVDDTLTVLLVVEDSSVISDREVVPLRCPLFELTLCHFWSSVDLSNFNKSCGPEWREDFCFTEAILSVVGLEIILVDDSFALLEPRLERATYDE